MNEFKVYRINLSESIPTYANKNWTDAADSFTLSDYYLFEEGATDVSEDGIKKDLQEQYLKPSDVLKINENYYYCNDKGYTKLIIE